MDEADAISQFYDDLRQTIYAEADADDDGLLRAEAFTEWAIHELSEIGEVEGGMIGYLRRSGIEVSGQFISDDQARLEIYITRARLTGERYSMAKVALDTALKRAKNFVVASAKDLFTKLEESSEAFDMALSIRDAWPSIELVKINLLTDADTRVDHVAGDSLDGKEVTYNVWDLTRLYRAVTSGTPSDRVVVDFHALCGSALQLFKVPEQSDRYDCYVGTISGEMLLSLYRRFGPRLLERNVRTFLQARGKVNKGIRETLRTEPEMFVAYNNGLSATCTGCKYEENSAEKTVRIHEVHDFQIINGGQTTGSIFNSWKKDGIDLRHVWVPIKLTEILSTDDLELIAPRISEYANTQNRVTTADFSSNDPYHVELERISRSTWAPAVGGSQKQTRWFYERSRGQYLDQLSRADTPAKKRAFKSENPSTQRFAKTDVAKYEHTWQQLPHLVSRGAQKNFAEFMQRREEQKLGPPDEDHFKRLVAKALCFKVADRLIRKQQFGGYKANLVTYTLAYISRLTQQRIDLERIWAEQKVSSSLERLIVDVSDAVYRIITDPPGGQNVTEYCKKESCWKAIVQMDISLAADAEAELLPLGTRRTTSRPSLPESSADEELISEIAAVPAEEWFGIANWAKVTQNLYPWQRKLAFSLGRYAGSERPPTVKQARQGKIILQEAIRLGFRSEKD